MTELGDRRQGVHERLVSRECAGCGATITYGGVGRWPRYCGAACRQRAWALRAAEKRLGTPGDPRPAVVREVVERETVVRIGPPAFTQVYLEAKEVAERAAAVAAPRVPNTGRDWALLLAELTDQLTDNAHPLAQEHWQHERLHTALAALDGAHPGGLNQLRNRRRRR